MMMERKIDCSGYQKEKKKKVFAECFRDSPFRPPPCIMYVCISSSLAMSIRSLDLFIRLLKRQNRSSKALKQNSVFLAVSESFDMPSVPDPSFVCADVL